MTTNTFYLDMDGVVADRDTAVLAFQLAIVLLSASILSVDKRMFLSSIGVSIFGAMLLTHSIWLILPVVI